MGYAFRSYFVDADGTVRPVTPGAYNRIAGGGVRLSGYAGRTVRSAHLALELERGRPTGWLHEDYVLVRFGPEGEVDRGGALLRVRLALQATLDDAVRSSPAQLAAARKAIEALAVQRRLTWQPDPDLRARILALARSRC